MRPLHVLLVSGLAAAAIVSLLSADTIARSVSALSEGVESAAVFFVPSITVKDLKNMYDGKTKQLAYADKDISEKDSPRSASVRKSSGNAKLRILIVPGHEPGFGGTEFNGILERELAVETADDLAALLDANPHYEVFVARTDSAWSPTLETYFTEHAADIEAFREEQANEMRKMVEEGSVSIETDQVHHKDAPSEAALHLYGINKWATDNNIDLTIHLHINDYAGRGRGVIGKYDGFTIYVPDHQYSNALASRAVGEAVAKRLATYHAASTLSKENEGVVDDQELIAVGSNNSADSASILIEYGYIYEPQFTKPAVRSLALSDYAYETYLGLQDFFGDSVKTDTGSMAFPYDWSMVQVTSGANGPGIYALQAALHYLRAYPPPGKTFSDCPVSGLAGDCTIAALSAFQASKGLEATGTLGPQTEAALAEALK
jgi:N-acetylmuramoyl-L-alanine amidase